MAYRVSSTTERKASGQPAETEETEAEEEAITEAEVEEAIAEDELTPICVPETQANENDENVPCTYTYVQEEEE